MCYDNTELHARLLKLYQDKCGQAEKARVSPNSLRYQILRAEADAIKAELNLSES